MDSISKYGLFNKDCFIATLVNKRIIDMRYKLLGKSGLRVSELCLGTMTFGDDWGWGAPKDTSRQIFDAFVEVSHSMFSVQNTPLNNDRYPDVRWTSAIEVISKI